MSKNITDALSKLDPTNDNHWTQDGFPRLDTIKILAADPSLTREQVTAAAPEFTRAAALAALSGGAGTTPPAPGDAGPVAPPAAPTGEDQLPPLPPPPEDPPLTAPPMAEDGDDVQALKNALDEALLNLNDKITGLQVAQQAVVDAQNAVGQIEDKLAKLSTTAVNPIQGYLAAQRKVLEERGVRKQLIKDSGLDLKQLAKDLKSPLDAAMERKNTRGGMRPPVQVPRS